MSMSIHAVSANETPAEIAVRLNVSLQYLLALNPFLEDSRLPRTQRFVRLHQPDATVKGQKLTPQAREGLPQADDNWATMTTFEDWVLGHLNRTD